MPSPAVIATALTTPLLAAVRPLQLMVAGVDLTLWSEDERITEAGLGTPRTLSFRIRDRTGAADAYLAKLLPVIWMSNITGQPLFTGWIKDLQGDPHATYVVWDVICVDRSDALDFSRPIASDDGRAYGGTDGAIIAGLVAAYGTLNSLGQGGFIQTLTSAMPGAIPLQSTNLRGAIETVLAATGVAGASYYVDVFGFLHTFVSGDAAAPYEISDLSSFVPGLTLLDQQSVEATPGAEHLDSIATEAHGGRRHGHHRHLPRRRHLALHRRRRHL